LKIEEIYRILTIGNKFILKVSLKYPEYFTAVIPKLWGTLDDGELNSHKGHVAKLN
jgi:hypothetical protein